MFAGSNKKIYMKKTRQGFSRFTDMDKQTALTKAEHYCAYQERSKLEVLNKLHEWDLSNEDINSIIETLEDSNYLNEERFSKAYALGKFRMKSWGRYKIKQGLAMKGLTDRLIETGLKEIDVDDYQKKLRFIISKKSEITDIENELLKKHTVAKYVIGQGYEPDLVWDVLENRRQ